jgi:hypothetical protein
MNPYSTNKNKSSRRNSEIDFEGDSFIKVPNSL